VTKRTLRRDVDWQSDRLGRAAYAAYDAAGVLATLFGLPLAPLLLGRGFTDGFAERLGRLPAAALALSRRPLWIHAASVGETLAAEPLVAELRRRRGDLPIVFSTTTATGRAVAEREIKPSAALLLPLDAWRIIDRAFARVRPRALIVVETEIWPGLLRAAERVGAPVAVVSGRLSARAARRYGWIAPLFRAALGKVAVFGMQTPEDARRAVSLGAPPDRVHVTGTLKAGRQPSGEQSPPIDGLSDRPVLIAASTQPGEEEVALAACASLWAERADLLLVVAPRRPERFAAVGRLVQERGLRYQRRSAMQEPLAKTTQVLVLDTLGELGRLLPAARAVFVGGTIAPLGGHNVLEPAACGKPVAFGPHTENVASAAAALLDQGGAVLVRSADELAALWRRCLAEPRWAESMGERARRVARGSADVVARTWELIAPLLEDRA